MYVWGWLPGGKRTRFYSINVMRARHPNWFKQDLACLFELLKEGRIKPKVAERISFDRVVEAHRGSRKVASKASWCFAPSKRVIGRLDALRQIALAKASRANVCFNVRLSRKPTFRLRPKADITGECRPGERSGERTSRAE